MLDAAVERAIDSASSLKRPSAEYEMTMETLKWLQKVDSDCKASTAPTSEFASKQPNATNSVMVILQLKLRLSSSLVHIRNYTLLVTMVCGYFQNYVPPTMAVSKQLTKKVNEGNDKTTPTKITKVPNGFVEQAKDAIIPTTGTLNFIQEYTLFY